MDTKSRVLSHEPSSLRLLAPGAADHCAVALLILDISIDRQLIYTCMYCGLGQVSDVDM